MKVKDKLCKNKKHEHWTDPKDLEYYLEMTSKTEYQQKCIFHSGCWDICDEQMNKSNATIGTDHYDGRSWFWTEPSDVKHPLRGSLPTERIKVHNAWIKLGIPLIDRLHGKMPRYLDPDYVGRMKEAVKIVDHFVCYDREGW